MKLFIMPCGTALDLEHLLAVGPLGCINVYSDDEFEDVIGTSFEFDLTLAFASSRTLRYKTKPEAEGARRRLLLAWEDRS